MSDHAITIGDTTFDHVDYDRHIVGITLVNAKLLLDRGDIHLTVPQVVDVQRDELKLALA